MKKTILGLLILVLCVVPFCSEKRIIITQKDVYISKSSGVSTRELAMLASLVYEYVPNDSNYSSGSQGRGCKIDSTGIVTDKNGKEDSCFYMESDKTAVINDNRKKYNVKQYLEGFSSRKRDTAMGTLTASLIEDGQKYYFLSFADVSELANTWSIVHASDTVSSIIGGNSISFDDVFSAITFHKKGTHDYVIAFRGTDFPDILEWLEDLKYAFDGTNAQTSLAYHYAQDAYKRIYGADTNANIYVTGHSLGAYLAQVGGAAIVDFEAGIDNTSSANYNRSITLNSFDDYTRYYANTSSANSVYNKNNNYYNGGNSRLKQVAYFNGMGVSAMFNGKNAFTQNIDNALTYLGTHELNGKKATDSSLIVNYSKTIPGSGRLVLYSIDSDPVSSIGVHYGQIYKLEVAADAIKNHKETHSITSILLDKLSLQGLFTSTEKLSFEQLKSAAIKASESLSKLDSKEVLEYFYQNAQKIQDLLARIIDASKMLSNNTVYVPSVVKTEIKKTGNYSFDKYSLFGVLKNVLSSGVSFIGDNFYNSRKGYDRLKNLNLISDVISFANMNHETDSFVCLMDSKNGSIKKENVKISVIAPKMKYVDGTWYSKSDYNQSNNYIKLVVDGVNGACADLYTWNIDGQTYSSIENYLIIPSLNLKNGSTVVKQVKLTIEYGDHFYETKTVLSGNNSLKFSKGNWTNVNPTINDGIKVRNTNISVDIDDRIQVMIDKVPPQSNVNNVSLNVSKGKTFSYTFNFIEDTKVNFSAMSVSLSKAGFLKKDGFENISVSCSASSKSCTVTGKAIKSGLINNLFANNNQTATFKVRATDTTGNVNDFTSTISLKRK